MPLQKLQYRPGVNREGTTLANEGGWFDCDKIRFRSGYPEKIGGWVSISTQQFIGTCRSLWNWITLKAYNLMGVGTESKFYIENGGTYYDITPIRRAIVLTNPFATNNLSSIVSVTDQNHGAVTGDYVTFSGASAVGGVTVNGQYVITYVNSNVYTIDVLTPASSTATGGGTVTAQYQINNGATTGASQTGWGAGYWGGVITGAQINQLSSALNNSATTIPVSSTTGFPAAGILLIDSELITYSGTSGGNSFTGCTRGTHGTTAASHLISTLVADASGYRGWGQSASQASTSTLRLWSQMNYGEDLLYNPRGGRIYIWQPGDGSIPAFSTRGTTLGAFSATVDTTTLGTTITVTESNGYIAVGDLITGTGIPAGATIDVGSGYTGTFTISAAATATGTVTATIAPPSSFTNATQSTAPTVCNEIMVSDATRIVVAFGCNPEDSTEIDPLLIRWSDQENYNEWTVTATTQAGSYRLSHGSSIVGVLQTRQEILIWTDSALYSMQYLGPPYVFGFTLLADNISIASPNAMATASGVTYWMGTDKFYVYSGRTETLPCSVRSYVFNNANFAQNEQFFAGTNEGYSEVWWFYCSITGPDGTGTVDNPNRVLDSYVIFNYLDRVWYYGTMQRTAWIDSPLRDTPIAASYTRQLVSHENGVNDALDPANPLPISCFVQSSDFDIGDGHDFGFVWQIVPDITFDGSITTTSAARPQAVFTVRPRRNPGAAYGSSDTPTVASTQAYNQQYSYNVQQFTQLVNVRLRGRQMAFRISSDTLGTQWQLGTPRINVRPDGRK